MITIRAALDRARESLPNSDTPDLDAQLLLAFILKAERVYLLAHADEHLSDQEHSRFQALLGRRAAGEPLAYITGKKWFFDLEFRVTPAVLIPRPETELLLEEALRLMAQSPACIAADIGTGSGALAVSFARRLPRSRVYASDGSIEALFIARENAQMHAVNVRFLRGDLSQPMQQMGIKLDLLMANLPYIPTADLDSLAVSRYEPRQALDGGPDGLHFISKLLMQVPQVCRHGAWVLLEIGADQGNAVTEMVASILGLRCTILRDYAGLDRIARFQFIAKH